jgi:hypothetical protein
MTAFVRGRDRVAESADAYFSALDRKTAGRRLVVWGAGRAGAIATAVLNAAGRTVALIVDADERRHAERLHGIPIRPLETLIHPANGRGDYVLLASMHAPAMAARLEADGWQRDVDFGIFPIGSIYRPEVGFWLEQLPDSAAADRRPLPVTIVAARHAHVATMFASAGGNFYFRELRDVLAAGLRRAGWTIDAADESATSCRGVPIIIGPHEFFSVGAGVEWLSVENLRAAVLVTTEQPQSIWFQAFERALRLAAAVVDVNPSTGAELAARGVRVHWLPLGWYRDCGVFDRLPDGLDSMRGIELPAGVLADPSADAWHARPIDVLFIGSHSPRRERWLRALQDALPDVRWFVHLPSDRQPVGGSGVEHIDTAHAVALARRSKILLNLHRDETPYFEWQRIVWRGLWQRTLVVTEPSGEVPPLVAGRDYVEAPVEEIAAALRQILTTDAGARDADVIRQAGCDAARAIPFAETEAVLAEAVRQVTGFSDHSSAAATP